MVIATVDANGLTAQAGSAALSFPRLHANGSAHDGQPVPTYSTVLLTLWPHVVMVSVPPSGTVAPSDRKYTSRGPGKKELKPDAHVPDVYMPGVPSAPADCGGAVPAVPARARTLIIPRQIGCEGDALAVPVAAGEMLRVAGALGDAVADTLGVGDELGVQLGDGEPEREPLNDALAVVEDVSEPLDV